MVGALGGYFGFRFAEMGQSPVRGSNSDVDGVSAEATDMEQLRSEIVSLNERVDFLDRKVENGDLPERDPLPVSESKWTPEEITGFEARANSGSVVLTDLTGRTIEAEIVEISETEVSVVRFGDRRSFSIPMNQLSDGDQEFLLYLIERDGKSEKVSGSEEVVDWDAIFRALD